MLVNSILRKRYEYQPRCVLFLMGSVKTHFNDLLILLFQIVLVLPPLIVISVKGASRLFSGGMSPLKWKTERKYSFCKRHNFEPGTCDQQWQCDTHH